MCARVAQADLADLAERAGERHALLQQLQGRQALMRAALAASSQPLTLHPPSEATGPDAPRSAAPQQQQQPGCSSLQAAAPLPRPTSAPGRARTPPPGSRARSRDGGGPGSAERPGTLGAALAAATAAARRQELTAAAAAAVAAEGSDRMFRRLVLAQRGGLRSGGEPTLSLLEQQWRREHRAGAPVHPATLTAAELAAVMTGGAQGGGEWDDEWDEGGGAPLLQMSEAEAAAGAEACLEMWSAPARSTQEEPCCICLEARPRARVCVVHRAVLGMPAPVLQGPTHFKGTAANTAARLHHPPPAQVMAVGGPVRMLGCGHSLHRQCLQAYLWGGLAVHRACVCPLCRMVTHAA